MFQEEYLRDLGNNYLVLSEEGKEYDEFQVQMLKNNRIAGLLDCEIRVIDGREKFLYEISSRQPISRIYEKMEMKYDALVSILHGISKAVESAREYLLDTGHLILKPEYMYLNPETNRLYLCFYPQFYMEPEQAFHELAEYILDRIDHREERGVVLAYDFYRKAREDNFNLRSILKNLTDAKKDPALLQNFDNGQNAHQKCNRSSAEKESTAPVLTVRSAAKRNQREKLLFAVGVTILGLLVLLLLWIQIYQPVILQESEKLQQIVLISAGGMGGIVAFIGFVIANKIYGRSHREKVRQSEEEIHRRYHAEELMQQVIKEESSYCGETTLLVQPDKSSSPKLVHMKDGRLQEIAIHGTPFIIGKMEKGVDAVIKEHSVSRMHARISEREGQYYLTDLNSTNGTYKNGVRLNANETTPIQGDDEIRFADMTFYFACC